MKFTRLVPNVFYTDINDALHLFVGCLGFAVTHDELRTARPFCVIEKDHLRINLFQNELYAKEHNPEFRLVTDDIESVYEEISKNYSEFLHPNLSKITLRPWGALEFAVRDVQLGIVIQQWNGKPNSDAKTEQTTKICATQIADLIVLFESTRYQSSHPPDISGKINLIEI